MMWVIRGFLLLVLSLILLGLGAFYYGQAHAHDHSRPDLDSWFNSLRSNGKRLCCSNHDGTFVADPDWDAKDGHYRVRLRGEWVNVPDDAVVTEPNLDGRTMVWPVYTPEGPPFIRCFMPGALT